LPSGKLLPRLGRIEIEILAPLDGSGAAPEALRDEARAQILARVGEPDLAAAARGAAARTASPPEHETARAD
jgi:hypothetical protein